MDQKSLEIVYKDLNISIFALTCAFELYVIGWKLRFKMDKAAYFILVTQLLVMGARIFMS